MSIKWLYNVYGPLILESGEAIGRPKATQCMTVEGLEAQGVKGLYGEDRDDDTDSATLVPGSGSTSELCQ